MTLASGLGLRVLESGPPDGTPLVLLHGWAISAYLWRHNIAVLAAAGYRVHAPDLPDGGLPGYPAREGGLWLEALADDIGALLDALNLEHPAVVAQCGRSHSAFWLGASPPSPRAGLALFGPSGIRRGFAGP